MSEWEECTACNGTGVVVVVGSRAEQVGVDADGWATYEEIPAPEQAQCEDCYATGRVCGCTGNPAIGHAPECDKYLPSPPKEDAEEVKR